MASATDTQHVKRQFQLMRDKVEQDIAGLMRMIDVENKGFIDKQMLMNRMGQGFELLPPCLSSQMTADQQITQFFRYAEVDEKAQIKPEKLKKFFEKIFTEMEQKILTSKS